MYRALQDEPGWRVRDDSDLVQGTGLRHARERNQVNPGTVQKGNTVHWGLVRRVRWTGLVRRVRQACSVIR